uniref:Uncharacterized protein n=1 Tax=uncultured delta proteobacterium HF0010_01J10 TaxID=710820 RepID=E0XQD0_9DELT|nr:hypothetical protein [uncultured delta proteobacterium HF0010_01J10]
MGSGRTSALSSPAKALVSKRPGSRGCSHTGLLQGHIEPRTTTRFGKRLQSGMGVDNVSIDERRGERLGRKVKRTISVRQLNTLLCLHLAPINQVVFLGP